MSDRYFRFPRKSALLVSTGLCLGLSSVALAQANPETGTAQVDTEAREAGTGPSDIIVTAQRRNERLQDVPIAITAITGDRLEASGATTSADIAALTPGFTFTSVGGYDQPRIRGIGTSATAASVESPVATYVDGVYHAHQSGSVMSLANVERVEVDKGPQGTLFGRNATGGLIQIITREPTQVTSGEFSVGYGNYDTINGTAYLSGGVSDNLAADISLYFQNQGDGYGTNIATGQEINIMDRLAARSKWVLDLDATKITLAFDYSRDRGAYAQAPAPGTIPPGGAPDLSPQDLSVAAEFRNDYEQGGTSLRIEHEFSAVSLISTTAYRQNNDRVFFPNAASDPAFVTQVDLSDKFKQFSQEFQLQSDSSGAIQWSTGLYFFHSSAGWRPSSIYGEALAPLTRIDIFNTQKTYSGAVYGQATAKLDDDTNLTLGLRYTIDKRDQNNFQTIAAPFPIPDAFGEGKKTFRKLTWRASIDHRFSDALMVYASVNRGYKSGAFNDTQIPVVLYKPEVVDAFEVGMKSDLFDRAVRLNLSSFFYLYKNIQVTRYINSAALIYNGAKAEIYGLDADAEIHPFDGFTLTAGASLLHARYTDFTDADITTPAPGGGTIFTTGDASGNRLVTTPDMTFNLSADYRVPLASGELRANATYYYNDGWFATPDERLRRPHYSTLNLSLSWAAPGDAWKVSLWGRNVTDEDYAALIVSQANGDSIQYAPPATYGATVSFKF